jgi:tetratricopeptide (TPR) repeat protein
VHEKLADAFVMQGQLDAAVKEYDAALEIRVQLAGKFPNTRNRWRELAVTYEGLGDALLAKSGAGGTQDDARDVYEKGLAAVEAFMARDANSGLENDRDRLRRKIQSLMLSKPYR